jgi:hypothetical protein
MFAPGYCNVFRDANGRELLAYHYYDARHYWVDGNWGLPTLQVRKLLWTDDGWPLPGMLVKLTGKPISGEPRMAGHGCINRILPSLSMSHMKLMAVSAAARDLANGRCKMTGWCSHGLTRET